MTVDLFASAAESEMESTGPLAERLRPHTLDDVVGQAALVGLDGTLRRLLKATRLPSLILWGPPGSGKTTIARLVSNGRDDEFVPLVRRDRDRRRHPA